MSDDKQVTERCMFCGTVVTPGSLIRNALDNGAMPRMAEIAANAMRLHTAETDALRKRVAELEEVLVNTRFYMDRSTLDRDVNPWLRAQWATGRPHPTQDDAERERITASKSVASPRPEARYRLFVALRSELIENGVCLDCGRHTPGSTCHCEWTNDRRRHGGR